MKPEIIQPELFEHGIHTEESDIRAHVGFKTQTLYAFPTKRGVEDMERCVKEGKTAYKYAFQKGVVYATGGGYPIPWNEIKDLKRARIPIEWFFNFKGTENSSTSEIGDYAVGLVSRLLKEGRFPLWSNPMFCMDVDLQIKGMDIIVKGRWRIEVKGDVSCGERDLGGTGNLFFQTHELNPLKRH